MLSRVFLNFINLSKTFSLRSETCVSDTWGVVIPFKQVAVQFEFPSHLDDLSDFRNLKVFHKLNEIVVCQTILWINWRAQPSEQGNPLDIPINLVEINKSSVTRNSCVWQFVFVDRVEVTTRTCEKDNEPRSSCKS